MQNIDLHGKTILVTGAAGFIGSFLARQLLERDASIKVIGADCMTDYYDVSLKEARLAMLEEYGERFVFRKIDIADKYCVENFQAYGQLPACRSRETRLVRKSILSINLSTLNV